MRRALVLLLSVVALFASPFAFAAAAQESETEAPVLFADPGPVLVRADEVFRNGVAAWREGRHARAKELWLETLEILGEPREPESGDELIFDRHALLHDLGNAAFREEQWLEASGWYLAALRYAPRDASTRANLELARERAGVEPQTRGPIESLFVAHLEAWTPGEARWLALIGLAPLALSLLLEAVRGGRALAWASVLSFLVALVVVAPLVAHQLRAGEEPLLVVRSSGVDVHSEARSGATVVANAATGSEVSRIDALPDWVRVETADGERGWVPRGAVFDLVR